MTDVINHFIAGKWRSDAAGERRAVVNPATDEQVASIACATADDVEQVTAAVQRAHPAWAAARPDRRAEVLRAIAGAVADNRDRIAAAVTRDNGKPIGEARDEIDGVVRVFGFFAEVAANMAGPATDRQGGIDRHVVAVPVGPVLIIGTWNFPVETIAVHLAPSLAAGCASIAIPNAITPSGPVEFFRALEGVGLPDGLVNLLVGNAAQCSEALIASPVMRHVSYTGSTEVGSVLAQQAAREIKRCTLELGGNAAAIVLPGTAVAAAVQAIGGKRYWNAGQVCTAPNRIYVPRGIYDEFIDELVGLASAITVGDGTDGGTNMGPLVSHQRIDHMRTITDDALERRADLLLGGRAPDRPGSFWPPTVIGNIGDDALGMQREIFGPIACVSPYDTVDEAIARANDSDLGLSAYVYGPGDEEAMRVGERLEAGAVGINQMVVAFMDAPFGGIKKSGLGFVGGPDAVTEYLRPRLLASRQRPAA